MDEIRRLFGNVEIENFLAVSTTTKGIGSCEAESLKIDENF